MALLIDGPPSEIEDLTAHDSQLLSVASSEGIDITKKLGLAQELAALEVEALLHRRNPRLRLMQVVITPWLRLWHTYRSLELVYADAYNSQLNDRYAGRRDQFRALAAWAYERLIETGVGITDRPVPRAGTPSVTPLDQGTRDEWTCYVTTGWVNVAGEEGACAPAAVVTSTAQSFSVMPNTAPQAVSCWNVYAGEMPESMVRQNSDPIPVDQTSWVIPGNPATAGPKPGDGQPAKRMVTLPRILQRG